MLFCANCAVKNCAKKFGEEKVYPRTCPTLRDEIPEFLKNYEDPQTRFLAHCSSISSAMDHGESRFEQTVRFARECGFKKLGIAFCISLEEQARDCANLLRREGFEVESVICKVGHHDRRVVDVDDPRGKPMCNPVAQAEYLNQAGTEFNIVIGLCVGHDTLFVKYSKAPVTVLIAKDHRYHNCPAEYFRDHKAEAGEDLAGGNLLGGNLE